MDTDNFVIETLFVKTIVDVVKKIDLENEELGGVNEKLVSSTPFGNFDVFSKYFKQVGQLRSSDRPPEYFIGWKIRGILDNKWKFDNFMFDEQHSNFDSNSGDFLAAFVGSEHFIRVYAYTKKEGPTSKHELNIYAMKTHMSCFESICCC